VLLKDIVEDFAPAAEDRGQVLKAEIPSGLTITADRELLTQMVVNSLENALRHTPLGASIVLGASRAADCVTITVADNGPGIPPHERDKVLRPFYRLETSRTTEGSGLGFSLIAAIAKQHGATLSLHDNNPGLRVAILFSGSAN
jgi:signal transduction histidine kinase